MGHEASSYSTRRGGGCSRRRFFWPVDGAAAAPAPIVVELVTSQGCNSCPPADRLLGELAGRDDVLPLSFHVTYWDRLGWPDTFGLEDSTRRQELYADWLGERRVYTPQMVIGGRIDVVGSARGRVLDAIELLRGHAPSGPPLTIAQGRLAVGDWEPGRRRDLAGRVRRSSRRHDRARREPWADAALSPGGPRADPPGRLAWPRHRARPAARSAQRGRPGRRRGSGAAAPRRRDPRRRPVVFDAGLKEGLG